MEARARGSRTPKATWSASFPPRPANGTEEDTRIRAISMGAATLVVALLFRGESAQYRPRPLHGRARRSRCQRDTVILEAAEQQPGADGRVLVADIGTHGAPGATPTRASASRAG